MNVKTSGVVGEQAPPETSKKYFQDPILILLALIPVLASQSYSEIGDKNLSRESCVL